MKFTLLQKINRLTWRDGIEKLQDLFLELYNDVSGRINSITGELVDNTDPLNPVINSPVTQAITNGETETSPSEDVLFDALLLKANLVGGKVPAGELPSYVDDVVEVANFAALPVTGEAGKIYITIDDNLVYRWTGSIYVEISPSQLPPDLQQVTDVGNVTTNSITIDNPSDLRRVDLSTLGRIGITNVGGFSGSIRSTDLTGSRIQELPNQSGTFALISQTVTNGATTTSPSEDAVFDFVATASPLATINEGNGNGIVRTGRTAVNYGSVGLDAIDLSVSTDVSSTKGATGLRAMAVGLGSIASGSDAIAMGYEVTSSGFGSVSLGNSGIASSTGAVAMGFSPIASAVGAVALGYQTSASGSRSFAANSNTVASGYSSFAAGDTTEARSFAETAIGVFNTLYTPGNTYGWNGLERVFGVGNGTDSGNRSDALIILKNGTITAPSITNALIATAGAKSLITKEYLDTTISSTSVLESVDEGNGLGIVRAGRVAANYGGVGLNAVDVSISNSASATKGATGSNSNAKGDNTIASGVGSSSEGNGAVASGDYSHAEGSSIASGYLSHAEQGGRSSGDYSHCTGLSTESSGYTSFASGRGGTAFSYVETVMGLYPTNYTPLSTTVFNSADRLFTLGNGTGVGAESNALVILKNGTITAPSLTNALITTAGTKALVTKEYVDGQAVVNTTTVALSNSDLNTAYPNAITGFRVYASSIIAGAAIYHKSGSIWLSQIAAIVA